MQNPYSITIQVLYPNYSIANPVGHVAMVANSPDGQTYAGFGPLKDGTEWPLGVYAYGKFDVQDVAPGGPPALGDFSTVVEPGMQTAYFNLPGTASGALAFQIWLYNAEQPYMLDQPVGRISVA